MQTKGRMRFGVAGQRRGTVARHDQRDE